MKEKVGTTKKQPAAKAAIKKAVKAAAKQDELVYVVASHSHFDDYKRAESSSDVEVVYKNLRPALKLCILRNLEDNCDVAKLETYSSTLFRLLKKKGSGPGIEDMTEKVNSLEDLVVLKKIYTELIKVLRDNSQGEYTMNPSQTIYSVHIKIVIDEE